LAASPIRVLVVDDYEPFRRFVRSTLERRPELEIVREASDGLEAVRQAEELQPDLILFDLGLPTLNGIEATRRVRKLSPNSKILFVSQESSADIAQEAFRSGALGYVAKTDAGRELLTAVNTVLRGEVFTSSKIAECNFTGALSPILMRPDAGATPWARPQHPSPDNPAKAFVTPSQER